MAANWWIEFRDRAEPHVLAFAAERGYFVDERQPDYRGGTNLITTARRVIDGRAVILKYYVNVARFRNESFCLRHFAPTGTVPAVYDELPDQIIVMDRLGGADVSLVLKATDAQGRNRFAETLAQALARFMTQPLPTNQHGYSPLRDWACAGWWGRSPRETVERFLACGRGIVRATPQYADPIFGSSLDLIESCLSLLDGQRQVLFHEDIWNARAVEDGQFAGFFDLEMCRLATEPFQLAAAMWLTGPNGIPADRLLSAYEEVTGRELDERDYQSMLAASHLYVWERISSWATWNGGPGNEAGHAIETSDVDWGKERLRADVRTYEPFLDIRRWFVTPS